MTKSESQQCRDEPKKKERTPLRSELQYAEKDRRYEGSVIKKTCHAVYAICVVYAAQIDRVSEDASNPKNTNIP